jgi:hypothetical protein
MKIFRHATGGVRSQKSEPSDSIKRQNGRDSLKNPDLATSPASRQQFGKRLPSLQFSAGANTAGKKDEPTNHNSTETEAEKRAWPSYPLWILFDEAI